MTWIAVRNLSGYNHKVADAEKSGNPTVLSPYNLTQKSTTATTMRTPHATEMLYAAGAGETITAVLPPKTRGEQVSGHKTLRVASITAAGLEAQRSFGPITARTEPISMPIETSMSGPRRPRGTRAARVSAIVMMTTSPIGYASPSVTS